MPDPIVATVIVSHNTRELTLRAARSVAESEGVQGETWVVDNASTDGSPEALRRSLPDVRVVELPENVGFGRANNVALERITAPFVLLLNSDARFAEPGGLRRLLDVLERDGEVGVVGPRLESAAGALEFSARSLPGVAAELLRCWGLHHLVPRRWKAKLLGTEFVDHGRSTDVDWLTGACLLLRREVVDEVGGFDPGIFLYGEELDWCWRIREAGWRIRLEPEVRVVHERGASSRAPARWRIRLAMAGDAYVVRKHRGRAYLLLAFLPARTLRLAAEVIVQGTVGVLAARPARRARALHAATELSAWLTAVLAGGRAPAERRAPPEAGA